MILVQGPGILLVNPLTILALDVYDGNFFVSNAIMLVLQVLCLGIPLWFWKYGRLIN